MGIFDGLPVPPDKSHVREELSNKTESWAAPRFDSLPQVVQILTSKDRETELQALKVQSEVIEDVVNEVVKHIMVASTKQFQIILRQCVFPGNHRLGRRYNCLCHQSKIF